jgi:hypothetical protein
MRWYQEEADMQPDRALVTAEALASMRCSDGDSDDRDRLMRALYDLSDGAFTNRRAPKFCRQALAQARRLIPIVKTRGPDDTTIAGGAQALFHTAASCFARGRLRRGLGDLPRAVPRRAPPGYTGGRRDAAADRPRRV